MEKPELYERIQKLKHKKFKMPDLTEANHRLYWEVTCRLGLLSDPRFPRVADVQVVLREFEFSKWKDHYYMPQGARQSLTYRSNRIEENLSSICETFQRRAVSDWVWQVREQGSWNTLGYVVAKTSAEANHLAQLMYTGLTEGKPYSGERPYLPSWDGQNDIFIMKMNERLLGISKSIQEDSTRIEALQHRIAQQEILSDHLLLNMSAFEKQ
tara:strand:+ start:384 stop:1019 length:636 start_codon:yes stop_codon:yes gene_type:complete